MPIFTFLIVNGFFKTKDLKRYLFRLLRVAMITQIIIWILSYINIKYVSTYNIEIYSVINIVFSFVMSLIFIYSLNNIIVKKNKKIIDIIKNILIMVVIFSVYTIFKFNGIIKIDYEFMVPLLAVIYYILFKVKEKNKFLYTILFIITMIIYVGIVININDMYYMILFSIPILLMYNEEIKSKSLKLQKLFYSIFIIQHTIYYIGGLIYTAIKLKL